MTFNEKLKKLRKNKNLTQEELAQKIYVTRTAVSKWESGKGYPSLDTLKILAQFYQISIDELISNEEIIDISKKSIEKNNKEKVSLLFSLLDILSLILFFLPVFSLKISDMVVSVSLFKSDFSLPELVLEITFISFSIMYGLVSLILIFIDKTLNIKYSVPISLMLHGLLLLVLLLTREVYAGVIVLGLIALKVAFVIKK